MKMMRFCICEIVVWLNLQLDPLEFRIAIQWWLGMSFSHHAIVVPGHVVTCLNRLWMFLWSHTAELVLVFR